MRTRFSTAILLAALSVTPALGQVPEPTPPAPVAAPAPPPPPDAPAVDVQGTVDGYNLDGRGMVNSVVIKAGDRLAQFNFPPDRGAMVAAEAPVGQQVTVTGTPERALTDRTLYRLTKLTPANGKALAFPAPGTEPTVHVEGTVRRLNVSGKGEVDGAVLDSGDFVHTGPESAVDLRVGAKVSADGSARPMADGHQAVEANTLNGAPVRRPPAPAPGRSPSAPAGRRSRGCSRTRAAGPLIAGHICMPLTAARPHRRAAVVSVLI